MPRFNWGVTPSGLVFAGSPDHAAGWDIRGGKGAELCCKAAQRDSSLSDALGLSEELPRIGSGVVLCIPWLCARGLLTSDRRAANGGSGAAMMGAVDKGGVSKQGECLASSSAEAWCGGWANADELANSRSPAPPQGDDDGRAAEGWTGLPEPHGGRGLVNGSDWRPSRLLFSPVA